MASVQKQQEFNFRKKKKKYRKFRKFRLLESSMFV